MAHYAEHVLPVLQKLPNEVRGKLYAPRPVDREIRNLYGVPVESGTVANSTAPLLCAGFQDLRYGRRPKCLIQHGVGQRYLMPDGKPLDSPSFAGGGGKEAVSLFIVPSQRVADLELARYPQAQAAVVGSPKLDEWLKVPNPRNGVVAVTFHWAQHAARELPEAGWAFETWRDTIAALAKVRPVIGTCHPRAAREIPAWYQSVGIEYVPRFADLLPRAEILVLDTSSAGFEWAALDRPTVWLRGRDWTDIKHGLRFGDPLPGPELGADLADEEHVPSLIAAIELSRERYALARAEVRQRVFDGFVDGNASRRAADAIVALMG